MSPPPLILLATRRQARREVAMAKLAQARQWVQAAAWACTQAQAELAQAQQSQIELLKRCALGANQGMRQSVLPSCQALVQQREEIWASKHQAWQQAQVYMNEQRKNWMDCERDTLRLEEWQQLQKTQTQRELANQENRSDDDQVSQGKPLSNLNQGASR
jgi:hypothetical protein